MLTTSLTDAESPFPKGQLLQTYLSIGPTFNAQRITNVLVGYSKFLYLASLKNFTE
jgi:hypothetical protein